MGEQNRGQQSGEDTATRAPATLEGITAAWHEASDALRDSERRYRELVEYSLGLICTHDLSGTLLSINPAAAKSLGYEPEDGIGHNLREFLAADTRNLFDDYLQRINEHGHDAGLMRVVTRTGVERVWMYRNVLSHGSGGSYVLGHAIDVTERVEAERELREREQALRAAHRELEVRVAERTAALAAANDQLRVEIAEREKVERSRERALLQQRDTLAFLTSVSDRLSPLLTFEDYVQVLRRLPVPFLADWTMVHVVNDDGSIRFVPGVHADPALEPLIATLTIRTDAIGALTELPRGVRPNPSAVVTLKADEIISKLSADGSTSVLEQLGAGAAAMLPLVAEGRVRCVLSLVSTRPHRFTSSEALLVEELRRCSGLALDRIHLYQQAQEANRLKDEFLGTLSHELRTPLNAIFGWARILRARPLDGTTAHAVAVIERNAEAQVRLIEEVLDVSRIITGKMMLAVEPVDMAAIVHATIDTVRPAAHAKRIRLEERIEKTPIVLGDSHRLQQAFWNLLSNALKFTGSDGTISVTLHGDPRAVEFEITDTGAGIRREVLPFVFDRFRQADSSTTRRYGGLGLGLAIVKHIVELHGGTVRAASEGEGRGATFTIQLPVASRAASEPVSSVAAQETPASASALRGRTVLVVEDHDDARELVVSILEGAGARVVSASNAEEAIDRAAAVHPDVVVADLGLPGEDGFVLLARLREMYPDLPALALTAYAGAVDRERSLAAGFERHVVKPVDPRHLVECVVAVLAPA